METWATRSRLPISMPRRAAPSPPSAATRMSRSADATVQGVSGPRRDYGGMTVNERLFVAGLVQQFDAAINSGDRQEAIELLRRVALSDAIAGETVDAVLSNPGKYG